ncbi:MAG: hypothetical protein ACK53Y_15180, partial [bacterium]
AGGQVQMLRPGDADAGLPEAGRGRHATDLVGFGDACQVGLGRAGPEVPDLCEPGGEADAGILLQRPGEGHAHVLLEPPVG